MSSKKQITIEEMKKELDSNDSKLWIYGKKQVEEINEETIRFTAGNTKFGIGIHYEICFDNNENCQLLFHIEFDENSKDRNDFLKLHNFLKTKIKGIGTKFVINKTDNQIEWKLNKKIKTIRRLKKQLKYMFNTFEPVLAQFSFFPNNCFDTSSLEKMVKKFSKKTIEISLNNLNEIIISVICTVLFVFCLVFLSSHKTDNNYVQNTFSIVPTVNIDITDESKCNRETKENNTLTVDLKSVEEDKAK